MIISTKIYQIMLDLDNISTLCYLSKSEVVKLNNNEMKTICSQLIKSYDK